MILNFFKRNDEVNEVVIDDDDEPEKDGIQILVEMANRMNPNWYEEAKAQDLASEDEEEREFWVEFYSHEDDD